MHYFVPDRTRNHYFRNDVEENTIRGRGEPLLEHYFGVWGKGYEAEESVGSRAKAVRLPT